MTNSGMRGAIVAVLLASFATLPAAANAATVSTTTSCVDVQSTTDQYVDITATGLDPSASYYPLLELSSGADDFEVGSPVDGVLTPDAAGNGTGSVWFDQGTYAATSTTAGDGKSVWLKLRNLDGYSVAAEIRVPACGADATPPVLSLPPDVTTDATSASGAAVSFRATASDAVDGAVPVTCDPASGSTFAVGTATATCSATDAAGNAARGTFTVTVRAQAQQASSPSLEDLLAQLRTDVLRGRSPKNACNTLNVIENQIRARTGKSITQRQADQYLAVAHLVGALLRCR